MGYIWYVHLGKSLQTKYVKGRALQKTLESNWIILSLLKQANQISSLTVVAFGNSDLLLIGNFLLLSQLNPAITTASFSENDSNCHGRIPVG